MQDPASAPTQDPLEATDDRRTRWSIYWLLIVCSLAVVCARLWQVESISYGESVPFLSANDRSRWCTIRSLGDHNTYAIDPVLQSDAGKSWDTIDKVIGGNIASTTSYLDELGVIVVKARPREITRVKELVEDIALEYERQELMRIELVYLAAPVARERALGLVGASADATSALRDRQSRRRPNASEGSRKR